LVLGKKSLGFGKNQGLVSEKTKAWFQRNNGSPIPRCHGLSRLDTGGDDIIVATKISLGLGMWMPCEFPI
jgi:hypothetical protein